MENKTLNYNSENNIVAVTNLSDWREVDALWYASDCIQAGSPCMLDMCNVSSLNPQAL